MSNSSFFGKGMEYKIIGDMLMEGLDCYVPLVDDHGVDCVVKKACGTFIEIQIKAKSKDALFANIKHDVAVPNFYFVFCSERMKKMWILSSEEFIKESSQNKRGKNVRKRTISLSGKKCEKYLCKDCKDCKDFSRLR